jgi:hypothetical protein
MRKGFLMGFLFHGGRQVRLLVAALVVMVGMTALAAPTMALDGPVLGAVLQVEDGTPAATPDAPDDSADTPAEDSSVAALPATGNGASQDDGASPLVIGAVALTTVVALGYLGLRLVGRRL